MNQREFLNIIVEKKITKFGDNELENLERAISNNVVFACLLVCFLFASLQCDIGIGG